ncbi:MAG: septal ring lytic transglycosylase RlpA family protein [Alphaproteobacteria bacterium]|nr:septal ring lytic transglycosylase RlpA family protein [Alphaproteobacteria bacterium]
MNALHRFFKFALPVFGILLLTGCAESQLMSHWAKKVNWPGQEENAGTYKIGKPYRVGSVWYYPTEDFRMTETGIASWYGPDFHGKRTANGERYDQHELTAAHRTLQMPSLVRVTNLENGRSVVVRINDRGPFAHGRIIDVSKRAAELLGFIGKGTARVRLEVLTRESKQMSEAAKRGMDTSRLTMADLERMENARPVATQVAARSDAGNMSDMRPIRVASNDTSLPESLQTPTITVEELAAPASAPPARQNYTSTPAYVAPSRPVNNSGSTLRDDEMGEMPGGMASGRIEQGRFMPAPVVEQEPVAPTGLFVQAGAFAVRANAEKLQRDLSGIAPVQIDPINVRGKTLYRVKLGPIASVQKADEVLERVIALGSTGARVVKK